MALKWLYSPTYKVKCPDGTTRIVYREINGIFPLCIPGWQGNICANLNTPEGIKSNVSAEYQTKIQGLLYNLDELNQSLMMKFRSAYITYQSNPCENWIFLRTQIEKLNLDHDKLTTLRMKIKALITFTELNPNNHIRIIPMFQDVLNSLEDYNILQTTINEIRESREIMKKLVRGKNVS